MAKVYREIVVVKLKDNRNPLYYGGEITLKDNCVIVSYLGTISCVAALDTIDEVYKTSIEMEEPDPNPPLKRDETVDNAAVEGEENAEKE